MGMDLANANVVINIGVRRATSDDLKGLTHEVYLLQRAIKSLGELNPKVTFDIKQSDITRIQKFTTALSQLQGVNIAVGSAGAGGVGGAGGPLSAQVEQLKALGKVDTAKIDSAAASAKSLAIALDKVNAARAGAMSQQIGKGPNRFTIDPNASSATLGTTGKFDKEGFPIGSTSTVKDVQYEINGVIEARVEIQKRVNEAGQVELRTLTSTSNMQHEVARKQARRRIQDELRGQDVEKNIVDANKRIKRWTKEQGYTEDPYKSSRKELWVNGKKVTYAVREFTKELKGGQIAVIRINEATNVMADGWRKNTAAAREMKRELKEIDAIQEKAQRMHGLGDFQEDATRAGFRRGATVKTTDRQTGDATTSQQYWKAQWEGIGRYTIAVRDYNQATGKMIERTLTGSQAARFLGDSIFRAAEKVLQWTIATSILFQSIRVIKDLGREIMELESNTVLLSRVADKLVSSYGVSGNAFELKRKIAERLTEQIIDLTQAIGGNASETQAAAAVFLRAGQSETEVIQSVTAALLAARIAEMEVAESSQLLVSAILQFNMAASQLLPTLNALNTLSNNYKVTTKDLLDSISRAGSVFAAHNGTLEELAAMTAVLAEATSRSGTQLGNALKTIQSRLDRVEVKKNIFNRLQVSTADMTGKARSLTDVILELQMRLEGLSETEQNEITIQAAGVRQRAIMVSALNEAEGMVLAYNKSLMESGSAESEFTEQANTIESAIKRINGTFSAIAKSASGPIGGAMRVIVNLVNGILQLINTFDGLAIKMVGYSAVFLALRFTVMKLVFGFKSLGISFVGVNSLMRVATINGAAAASMFTTVSGAATVAGIAVGSLAASLYALLTPMNLLTLGLGLAVWGISEYVTASAVAEQATKDYLTLLDSQISAEEKRRRAMINTVNTVSALAAEIHRLNIIVDESGDKDGKYLERMKARARFANEILESVGFDKVALIDSKGNLQQGAMADVVKQGVEAEQKSLRENQRRMQIKLSKSQRELKRARDEAVSEWPVVVPAFGEEGGQKAEHGGGPGGRISLESGEEFEKYALEITRLADRARLLKAGLKEAGFLGYGEYMRSLTDEDTEVLRGHDRILDAERAVDSWAASALEADGDVKQLEDSIEDLNKELKDTESQILSFADKIKLVKARGAARTGTIELQNTLKGLAEIAQAESATGFKLPFEDKEATLIAMRKKLIEVKNATQEWIDLHEGVDAKTLEPYLDQLEAVNVKLQELNKHRIEIRKQRQGFATSQLEMRDKLAEAYAANQKDPQSRKFLSEAMGFDNAEDLAERIKERILSARDEFKRMMSVSPVTLKEYQDQEGDKLGRKVYIQKELERLSTLTLEKGVSLLKIETQIAAERKKSADEAARALGVLSSTDKLRVLAQAQYFKNNPNRKISVEDAFMSQASGVKITQQFWGGRMKGFDPNGSGLEKLLAGTGFGMTQEIVNSQDRLTEAMNGHATVFQRASELFEEAVNHLADARIISGESSIVSAPRRSVTTHAGEPSDGFTINVHKGAVDFSGFTTDFMNLLKPLVSEAIANEVRNIRATAPPEAPVGIKPMQ